MSTPAPRILLALDLRAPSMTAVERAVSVARGCHGSIDIVAVVQDGWQVGDHRPWLLARFALAVDCIASGEVQNVDLQIGSLQAAAIAAGLERRPDLVVLGATTYDSGPVVVAITEALGAQVLVARDHQTDGACQGPTAAGRISE